MGVLKVQGDKLDFAYMRRWAAELDITELLEKAELNARERRGKGALK